MTDDTTHKKRAPITLEEAQFAIRSGVRALEPHMLPLGEALGRLLAEDITAQLDQPPFPRSPYDGYALRAADTKGADPAIPVRLRVVGASYAGMPAQVAVEAGQAVRIMTGGCIPAGADCVVPQEKTDEGEAWVNVFAALHPYDNYCHRGEDFHSGDILAGKGSRVTAAHLAVAASTGRSTVRCVPLPSVAVVSVGTELRLPGEALGDGQILNGNGPYMAARLRELGLADVSEHIVDDDLERIRDIFLACANHADLIITTGGVSVGQLDLVPEALCAAGAKIRFHGVKIKPGSPALYADLGGLPVLALSGNPFAAATGFELLVRQALAVLSGGVLAMPQAVKTALGSNFSKSSSVRRFLRGRLQGGVVTLPPKQGNGQMSTMVGCNCLVDIAAGSDPLAAGSLVDVLML